MMHFFRRSKIHIDCFTSRRDVVEYAPIVNGIEAIPDWWKKLSKNYVAPNGGFVPLPTMKTCTGVIDYYDKSIAMPLWCDMAVDIKIDRSYEWQFSDKVTEAHFHNSKQYLGFRTADNYGHLKIISPWAFCTKEDVNWILTDPIYSHDMLDYYSVAQGLLNFKRQVGTHIQIFINVSKPKNYIVPFNTPFMFTPMTDKKVVIHRHLVSTEKLNSIRERTAGTTFINKYRTQQKVVKCPFKDEIK